MNFLEYGNEIQKYILRWPSSANGPCDTQRNNEAPVSACVASHVENELPISSMAHISIAVLPLILAQVVVVEVDCHLHHHGVYDFWHGWTVQHACAMPNATAPPLPTYALVGAAAAFTKCGWFCSRSGRFRCAALQLRHVWFRQYSAKRARHISQPPNSLMRSFLQHLQDSFFLPELLLQQLTIVSIQPQHLQWKWNHAAKQHVHPNKLTFEQRSHRQRQLAQQNCFIFVHEQILHAERELHLQVLLEAMICKTHTHWQKMRNARPKVWQKYR